MHQQFDCNQLFAQYNVFYSTTDQISQKYVKDDGICKSQPCTDEVISEHMGSMFSLQVDEPKQVDHVWVDNQEYFQMDKISDVLRKNTTDIQIMPLDDKQGPTKSQKSKLDKNETKNIPKNFGKAILIFLSKNKKMVKEVLQKYQEGSYKELMDFLEKYKKEITTIAHLRSLWTENKFQRTLRSISCIFLRKYSMKYIFNSRICNYGSHIKYRQRFLEVIKEPIQFKHIKQY